MDFHPIANLFPLIEGKEFEDLTADIKRTGYATLSWSMKVLGGRNRYNACKAAGIDVTRARLFSGLPRGVDPYDFVISAKGRLHYR